MAVINMLAWNIEVFGPGKYGNSPNNVRLVNLIGRVAAQQNANIVVLMELMTSISYQVAFNVCEAIGQATASPWRFTVLRARPGGDREAYAILWRTNLAFQVLIDGAGNENVSLSTLQFPNNFSGTHGRRAALAAFRTTDTNQNFTVSVYHAPPNQQAILGLERLAQSPMLYSVNNGGVAQPVGRRILGGDYNLNVNVEPGYSWLTNPVPAGAGTVAVTNAMTHLGNMADAVRQWGTNPANWGNNSGDYRDLQLDNIFSSPVAAAGSGVVDLVADVMNAASPVRAIAQTFVVTNPLNNMPAFPNSWSIQLPLNVNLNWAGYAWMLVRYGISDHLPVFASVNII